ncbi:MAG: ATP-binding cassette domain-containing protein [Bacteroidetes bacterium]|nr:ATP-binding cassette domain-containing protein [Bacteroidota bacterium]
MLKLEDIYSGYRSDNMILSGLALQLETGESLGITGRNGAGKTTLLNTVTGNIPYRTGTVQFHGTAISRHKLREAGIGVFLQGGVIFPHLNIRENIRLACPGRKYINRVEDVAGFELFGNSRYAYMKAGNLSGGERNLLALLMAVQSKPSLLLLDEPFAGISPSNARMIRDFIIDFRTKYNPSIILVEQNSEHFQGICDRIMLLKNGRLF